MLQLSRRRFAAPAVAIAVAGAVAALVATAGGPARAVGHMRPAGIPQIKIGPLASFQPSTAPVCDIGLGPFNCYTPADMKAVYDYPTGAHAPDGSGQTIVVVDAYVADYAQATGGTLNGDLAAFDQVFGLPAPAGGGVTVVQGPASTCTEVGVDCSGDAVDWAAETALDVEYAHAMAPGAAIVVASASSDSNADINAAEAAVLPQYPGAIVSQSFGGDEAGANADLDSEAAMHAIFEAAVAKGDTLIASAGDFGATDGNSYVMASYPASDPLVLAVGGTQGHPYPDGLWNNGSYGAEEVWNEPQLGNLATGGAPSVIWNAPSWQRGLDRHSFDRGTPMRTVPDVAYDGAVQGGVLTVQSVGGQQYIYVTGGTSAGSPQWAGIVALADQLRAEHHQPGLGVVAQPLYELARNPRTYRSDFHDIVAGNNAPGSGNAPLQHGDLGFPATPGYDLATGLGTPDVANLIGDLVSRNRGEESPGSGGPGKGEHGGRGGRGRFTPGR